MPCRHAGKPKKSFSPEALTAKFHVKEEPSAGLRCLILAFSYSFYLCALGPRMEKPVASINGAMTIPA